MLGKLHIMEGEFQKAINVFTQAVEHFPENPEILTTLGLLFMQVGLHTGRFLTVLLDEKSLDTFQEKLY